MRCKFIAALVFTIAFCFFVDVIHAQAPVRVVSTLKGSGPGSLRAAIMEDGPAIVKFRVRGDIFLQSPLQVFGDDITIDASGSGKPIRIIGYGLHVMGSRCTVKHLNIWVGNYHFDPLVSTEQDGILIKGTKEKPVSGGKILNCTIFAAVDEGFATYGPVENIDFGLNIIAWGLSKSHHRDVVEAEDPDSPKNHHSMAVLISPESKNIRMVQNLIALNRHRNPRVMQNASLGFVNNVVYGWGSSIDDGLYIANTKKTEEPLLVAFVGNYYKGNSGSSFGKAVTGVNALFKSLSGDRSEEYGSVYRKKHAHSYAIWDSGNVVVDEKGTSRSFNPQVAEFASDYDEDLNAQDFSGLLPGKKLTAEDAYKVVLRYAGANPESRDQLTTALVEAVIKGEGTHIDSPREVTELYPKQRK